MQHRSDTLFRDPGALARKVLHTFARPALLSCFTTYPFKDLFFIHGRFEHQPKFTGTPTKTNQQNKSRKGGSPYLN